MHKYFARRPYNVFQNIIEHYSKKNDIILDCFCGGGVTIFEAAALERKVIGVDINPLATFITRMQMFNGDIDLLKSCFANLIDEIKKEYNNWYNVIFQDDEGVCEWVEWVYEVACPICRSQFTLTQNNKIRNGIFKCPNKNCNGHEGVKRIECTPIKSIPLRTRYHSKKNQTIVVRNIDSSFVSFSSINYHERQSLLKKVPNFEIPRNWDRQHEDKLFERGIIEYKHLFTERNFTINCCIFNSILEKKEFLPLEIYEMLYFLFSSSIRYTNNMTRVTDNDVISR